MITITTAAASFQSDEEVLGASCTYALVLSVTLPGRKVRPIVLRSCNRAGTHIKSPDSVLAIGGNGALALGSRDRWTVHVHTCLYSLYHLEQVTRLLCFSSQYGILKQFDFVYFTFFFF